VARKVKLSFNVCCHPAKPLSLIGQNGLKQANFTDFWAIRLFSVIILAPFLILFDGVTMHHHSPSKFCGRSCQKAHPNLQMKCVI
jgi:hypothetical protein